jgi:PKHD-type hydroxylase
MRNIWQLFEGSLSDEDCDKIIELGKTQKQEDATIFRNVSGNADDVRKSKVSWIIDPWLNDYQNYFFKVANANAFGFVADLLPDAQFTTYNEGDHYTWHYDVNWEADRGYDRKLSMVIQLSDPKDYEGGIFEFEETLPKLENFQTRGSVLVFPSYLRHRVTKITKGERKSLVNWLEGPRWK